ncbi:LysE family transporter [Pseudomonas sp. ODNR1LW]|nr:LysE family transporter [Pseudomonas sp. ODNR1LW]
MEMPISAPVDSTVVLPFLVAVILIELTPGPNMGWLALLSVSEGRRAGFYAVAGITLGLTFWMLAAAFGLTEIVLAWPSLYQLVRWTGVIFLLWLAWEAWRVPPAPLERLPEDGTRRRALFLRGLTANLLNPKAALFYIALLPGFIRPDHGPTLPQALTLGGIHVAVSVAVHGSIVVLAARVGALAGRGRSAGSRGLTAGALVLIAAWTAWETRL